MRSRRLPPVFREGNAGGCARPVREHATAVGPRGADYGGFVAVDPEAAEFRHGHGCIPIGNSLVTIAP